MKTKLLKIPVLLFTVSAAGMYVWHASRKNAVPPAEPAATNDFTSPMPGGRVVTDEEVRATREKMLKSSKSGLVMNDEDIRRMLESQPPPMQQADANQTVRLMGSTKNANVLTPDEAKLLIPSDAGREKQPAVPPVKPGALLQSSKSIDSILRGEDVRKLVEPDKQAEPIAEPARQ